MANPIYIERVKKTTLYSNTTEVCVDVYDDYDSESIYDAESDWSDKAHDAKAILQRALELSDGTLSAMVLFALKDNKAIYIEGEPVEAETYREWIPAEWLENSQ
jgi:hypothetical protein